MAIINMNTRFSAIKIASIIALALALTACGTAGGGYDYGANSPNENAAAWGLLGGTAFVNGYNSGRSAPLPMVNYGNRLTMCSGASGMIQCY